MQANIAQLIRTTCPNVCYDAGSETYRCCGEAVLSGEN